MQASHLDNWISQIWFNIESLSYISSSYHTIVLEKFYAIFLKGMKWYTYSPGSTILVKVLACAVCLYLYHPPPKERETERKNTLRKCKWKMAPVQSGLTVWVQLVTMCFSDCNWTGSQRAMGFTCTMAWMVVIIMETSDS